MKNYKLTLFSLLAMMIGLVSCEYEGIDPITEVDPGADAANPQVKINYPLEGTTINVLEEVSTINIKFEVVDDIEIANIDVTVDGNIVANFNDFTDYRIVKEEVEFTSVTNGEHTLTVAATDIAGNTSTKTVNFSKEPPYSPKFNGEYLYMPFDGAFMDLVTIKEATVVGSPGFSNDAFLGTSAYKGASDSYLNFPFDGSIGQEFSAAFWYKVSGDPDRAAILVAGDDADDRMQGFRLFREGSPEEQRLKLNVGTGTGESWNDGGVIDVNAGEWVHVAFTVSGAESVIYFNGVAVNTASLSAPVDWTGVEQLTIGAGGETFGYWGHEYDNSNIDELRLFEKALSQDEVQNLINASSITLYMPFDGEFKDKVANREVTVNGSPSFAGESAEGSDAYSGAADSYLTMPSEGLLSEKFSATFWYKVNSDPGRAGILTVGPEDTDNAGYPGVQNKRTSGFRLFREGSPEEQRIKLNVGTGEGESWNDGGVIDVTEGEWVHVAFTISESESAIYLNGELVNTGSLSMPVDWTGTDLVSVMSGAPRFTEWGHLADTSLLDELRFYNKTLTEEEIKASMSN
ncbi:LamG-like jellyroll fold domain-containing protein [Christiangramia salexigens]|uniref:LamG-like jellyroll fold domain-containing protein n=1 Tax=Christiangramia salexigens TaxID=1913577 RepID=A0A1L3J565_9FLAO|nr:LamG-like jellyroll fold domain-containing protein [Christiangramia salexigens]APG60250.1 hypothetical protein LPB144_07435 [Christiangramia salexigens]